MAAARQENEILLTQYHSQESRLASTVPAEEGRDVTLEDFQCHVFEDDGPAAHWPEGLPYIDIMIESFFAWSSWYT